MSCVKIDMHPIKNWSCAQMDRVVVVVVVVIVLSMLPRRIGLGQP